MARTTIPPELVAVNAIQGTLIADNSVTAVHIATNAISGTLVADNAITSTHIAQNNVTATQIAQNTITVTQMADSAIETAKINADAVTGAKIADNAIDSEHYTDGSIDTAHIADAQITAAKIGANAVTLAKMASLARGSILVGDSAADVSALAIGSNGTVLKSDGTDVSWGTSLDISGDIDVAGTFDVTGATTLDSTLAVNLATPFGQAQISDTDWSSGAPYGTVLTVTGNNTNDANWGHLMITDSSTGTGNGGMIRFATGSTSSDMNPFAGIDSFTEGSAYGGLKFLTRPNGGTATARMTILSDGNVGIGTTSPAKPLHIYSADNQPVRIESSDAYAGLELKDNTSNASPPLISGVGDAMVFYQHNGTAYGERMRIHTDGKVGIGTTSPAAYLDVRAPSGVVGPTVAQFKSDQHGLGLTIGVDSTATYLNSNNNSYPLVLQSGGAPVLVRTATINGNTSSMHIDANTSNKFCTTISHNGNTTNRFGLQIACGTDDNSGTNTMVSFLDGNFDGVGSITASGGTVTYGAFTAHHEVNIPDSDNPSDESDAYPYGTLVEIVSTYLTDSNKRQSIRYTVQKSQSANSKKVLGAYASNMRPSPMCPTTGTYANNLHNISILGDGHVLCNNTGGNIEIGDGICTSAVEGIGMKATTNPSMIVAIAQEDVTFSGSETKLVAVQFGVQQFTPWS